MADPICPECYLLSKGCLAATASVGLLFYAAVYFVFKWMGFDAVQSLLLTVGLAVALTGLAFEVNRRMEDA